MLIRKNDLEGKADFEFKKHDRSPSGESVKMRSLLETKGREGKASHFSPDSPSQITVVFPNSQQSLRTLRMSYEQRICITSSFFF